MKRLAATLFLVSAAPVFADVDPCLLGIWRADTTGLRETYQAIQPLGTVTKADGGVFLSIKNNGTGVGWIDALELTVEANGQTTQNIGSGTYAFTVSSKDIAANVVFTKADINVKAYQITAGQPPALVAEQKSGVDDISPKQFSAAYTCVGNALTLDLTGPGISSLRVWRRQ